MNLPDWINTIPIIGAIVTISGISIQIGGILQKLDHAIDDVKNIKDKIKILDRRVLCRMDQNPTTMGAKSP